MSASSCASARDYQRADAVRRGRYSIVDTVFPPKKEEPKVEAAKE